MLSCARHWKAMRLMRRQSRWGGREGERGREEATNDLGHLFHLSHCFSLSYSFPQKILEAADKQQDVVELDLPGVKKLFLGLERKIQVLIKWGQQKRRRGRGRGQKRDGRPKRQMDDMDAVVMVPAMHSP